METNKELEDKIEGLEIKLENLLKLLIKERKEEYDISEDLRWI